MSAGWAVNLGGPELVIVVAILAAMAVPLLVIAVLVGAFRRRQVRPSEAGAAPVGNPPSPRRL